MLNKYFPVLLVRVRSRKPFFRITIPIAFYVCIDLLDCAIDLVEIAQMLFARRFLGDEKPLFSGVLALVTEIRIILSGLSTGEKFDLVNVEAEGVSVQIRVW